MNENNSGQTDAQRPKEIAVNIPTKESEPVISGTLDALAKAEQASGVRIRTLRVVDDHSEDRTVELARDAAEQYGWDTDIIVENTTLPEARALAIQRTDAPWFLFLDDDVRVSKDYLETLANSTAPLTGGVQGRKASRTEHPSDWTRRRSRRAGTHATLIRTEAVRDIQYPEDLTVLEDEFTRRHVERSGYLWTFNHRARFTHDSQDRHPIGWTEGFLGGKYGLSAFHTVALNVPFSLATGRNPVPHVKRALGWLAGDVSRRRSDDSPVPEPMAANGSDPDV